MLEVNCNPTTGLLSSSKKDADGKIAWAQPRIHGDMFSLPMRTTTGVPERIGYGKAIEKPLLWLTANRPNYSSLKTSLWPHSQCSDDWSDSYESMIVLWNRYPPHHRRLRVVGLGHSSTYTPQEDRGRVRSVHRWPFRRQYGKNALYSHDAKLPGDTLLCLSLRGCVSGLSGTRVPSTWFSVQMRNGKAEFILIRLEIHTKQREWSGRESTRCRSGLW